MGISTRAAPAPDNVPPAIAARAARRRGLIHVAHIDALTAYLATSPGGLDSVAIIAASTPRADLQFVLALQSVRLLLVIGLASPITRLVVRLSPHLQNLRTHK